jgi:large subunit ribosomal protein L6
MSRIGKLPVEIPSQVKLELNGSEVKVSGPKGNLEKHFNRNVNIQLDDNILTVEPANSSRLAKALHGTTRSIISNMVEGVVSGFSKNLEINGVGFKAHLTGNKLDLALGYSHEIVYEIPVGVSVDVSKDGTKLKVEGADKHMVGQVAATIKSYYPVEPYKGKGVTIVGEFVRRKEGKKTA